MPKEVQQYVLFVIFDLRKIGYKIGVITEIIIYKNLHLLKVLNHFIYTNYSFSYRFKYKF